MKYLFLIVLLASTFTISAQITPQPKKEIKGKLTEITLFYENGNIMQHGFYTEDGTLHAAWESYDNNGSISCIAFYNYGVKVGTWTYFTENKITKIVYNNNKIESIEEYPRDSRIKNN